MVKEAAKKMASTPSSWVIFLFILGASTIRGFFLPEADVFWQTRAGQDTINSGHIPSVDTWNWLLNGKEWLPNSWLWNVVLAGIYNTLGVVGLGLFSAALTAATLILINRTLTLLNVTNILNRTAILLISILALLIWLTARPQQVDYLLLLTFMALVLRFKKLNGYWFALISLGLSATWMNFHLTAPLAVFLFPAVYWVATTRPFKKKWLQLIAITIATAAGTLATPFGLDGITKTLLVVDQSRNIIPEWMSIPHSDGLETSAIIAVAFFGLGFIAFALRQKQWVFAVFLLILTIMSYQAVRFSPFLVLFALLGSQFIPEIKTKQLKLATTCLLVFVSLFAGAGLVSAVNQLTHPNRITIIDPTDFDQVPKNSRMLTLPTGGGISELVRPDVSASLDGRNDIIGQDRIIRIAQLFYTDSATKVRGWLNSNKVDSVFVLNDRTYKISTTMKTLGWTEVQVPDGQLWLRP